MDNMIMIYLDTEFKCYSTNFDGSIPFETDFFIGREELIPKYRIVPEGKFWKRSDGTIFKGLMISPI